DCIAQLSRLRAPLGVWGGNGNHEIYAGVEAEAAALFDRFGMKLLRRENAELRWHGSAFNLIGVDYQRQRDPGGIQVPMLAGVEPLNPPRHSKFSALAQSEFFSARRPDG